jgi:short-subunit dehydrogenase involved in D-alanine esterification of teichoic acids
MINPHGKSFLSPGFDGYRQGNQGYFNKELESCSYDAYARKAEDLQRIVDVECIRLDVTNVESIKSAISETIEKFGQIDAVVNNAGFAVLGPFEAATQEQINQQFQTNVFGLMNVCREILPVFREQKRGTIVNVASMGGRITFRFTACTTRPVGRQGFASFSLVEFNIKIKIIEPVRSKPFTTTQSIAKKKTTAYDNFVSVLPICRRLRDRPDGSVVAQASTMQLQMILADAISSYSSCADRRLPDGLFFDHKKSSFEIAKLAIT